MPESVLLDTHVWLWVAGGERFAPAAQRRIEQAAGEDELALSPISIWEVGMLSAKQRIALQPDCMTWVTTALAKTGVRLLPMSACASSIVAHAVATRFDAHADRRGAGRRGYG